MKFSEFEKQIERLRIELIELAHDKVNLAEMGLLNDPVYSIIIDSRGDYNLYKGDLLVFTGIRGGIIYHLAYEVMDIKNVENYGDYLAV